MNAEIVNQGQQADTEQHHSRLHNMLENRSAILLTIAATACVGALSEPLVSSESASARSTTKLPRIAYQETIPQARKDLRKAKLKAAGVQPLDDYPNVDPGNKFVAAGWAVKTEKRVIKNGKTVKRQSFKPIRSGTSKPEHTPVYVIPKQVPITGVVAPIAPGPPFADIVVPPKLSPPVGAEQGPEAMALPPATSPAEQPTPEVKPTIDLKAETEKYLKSETLYLPYLGPCSGTVVRDSNNKPIGAVTAQHCGFRPDRMPRIMGSDGNLYVVIDKPVMAQHGEDLNNLTDVGVVDTAIVPAEGDYSSDMTILGFKGEQPEQVLARSNARMLTAADIAALKTGRETYVSGYPFIQPNNTSGVLRRQTLKMTFLGQVNAPGYNMPVMLNGISANSDGSICSVYTSGASGIVSYTVKNTNGEEKAVFRTQGSLLAYDDFTGRYYTYPNGISGEQVRTERENQTGFKLGAYDGLCMFSNQKLDLNAPNKPAVKLRIVQSADAIPGYVPAAS